MVRQSFLVLLARSFTILVLTVISGMSAAQTQCDWSRTADSISQACGFVGIGTTTPHTQLHVTTPSYGHSVFAMIERTSSGSDAGMIFRTSGANSNDWHIGKSGAAWNEKFFFSFGSFPAPTLVLTPGGNVGVGTSSPGARIHIVGTGTAEGSAGIRIQNTTTGAVNAAAASIERGDVNGYAQVNYLNGADTRWAAGMRAGDDNYHIYQAAAYTDRFVIDAGGNVGIGVTPAQKLHVAGNGQFTGTLTAANIAAHFQDVAEWVPSTGPLAAGTVVVLSKSSKNTVTACQTAYDTSVAGVVSAAPGLILGEAAANSVMVATFGRVKVRVDATRAPVAVGDLLVTSDVAGTAMRSEPMSINGRSFHQPGTIIGKALEELKDGTSEILVLLSLQ